MRRLSGINVRGVNVEPMNGYSLYRIGRTLRVTYAMYTRVAPALLPIAYDVREGDTALAALPVNYDVRAFVAATLPLSHDVRQRVGASHSFAFDIHAGVAAYLPIRWRVAFAAPKTTRLTDRHGTGALTPHTAVSPIQGM